MKEKTIITEEQAALARFAKALGHPVRIYVLQLLARQSCCYTSLKIFPSPNQPFRNI